MSIIQSERRKFPRVNASLPINITPEFLGEIVDLSETGLKFILDKPLLLSKAHTKIQLSPEKYITTEFKVIWNKHLIKENKFIYGVCFIRLKEKDLEALRSILVTNNLNTFLIKTYSQKKQNLISLFWEKDFKEYLDKLVKVTKALGEGLDKEAAYKEVTDFNDNIMRLGDELEDNLDDKTLIKKIKKAFRETCGPWVYKAKIVKWAFAKPRGYPGDYKLIEIVYDNKPLSDGLGYCYDRYLLNNKYAIAVRNRKDMMRKILKEIIASGTSYPKMTVLNLACGSCRELKEIFIDQKLLPKEDIAFTLIDQDEEALKFSKYILADTTKKVSYRFMQHNVLEYIKHSDKYLEILGEQNLVYSIGLADYLPDRVLKNLITFCFSLLRPKGKLIIAHKDVSQYKPLPPDWWCDWTFYPRDESYLLNIVTKSGIDNFNIKITREPSNIILFITIEKI